jgi:indole-3-glycerol phosphate synthase
MTQQRNILNDILAHKRETEVPARKRAVPLDDMRRMAEAMRAPARNFAVALHRADGCVALIAEVKRASPSKGDLVKGAFDPVALATAYEANGAACISVLTDENYFKGSLDHLRVVKQAVNIPVLRKDFIVDAYQLYEARAAGADAALLIVAALDDDELRDLHALAHDLTLTALVEVHDAAETERAMKIGATVIGVNNRDLRTFKVDIETTKTCAQRLEIRDWRLQNAQSPISNLYSPISNLLSLVSESGIFTPAEVARVAGMGANAILVGESIITSGDLPAQVRALASVPRRQS